MGSLDAKAQVDPIFVSTIPLEIDESSGLEFTSINSLWSHNDTDNDPLIMNMDASGNYLGDLELSGVVPVDFEDVAYDGSFNFYIGEFGNNENDRTDLKIYKIPNPDLLIGTVNPEIVNFTLSDQVLFPPPNSQKNFDIEAMFYFNGSIHLFSKNRTNPFDGLIKHYKLNPGPGTQVAELQNTYFANLSENHASITGADISPDGTRIALLTNSSIFLFTEFNSDNFFDGTQTYNFFNGASPKEGITFIDECTVMISEESDGLGTPGDLYSLNTCSIVPLSLDDIPGFNSVRINYFDGIIGINTEIATFDMEIYNSAGSRVAYTKSRGNEIHIDINHLSPGLYGLKIISENGKITTQKIIHF